MKSVRDIPTATLIADYVQINNNVNIYKESLRNGITEAMGIRVSDALDGAQIQLGVILEELNRRGEETSGHE